MRLDASGVRIRMVPIGLVLGLVLQITAAVADEAIAARVSFDSSGGRVKGAADADWTPAAVNKIVLAGDAVSAGKEGTLEVETPVGTYLRMAAGSEGKVVSLMPSVMFKGTAGSFYLQRVSRSSGDVIFETPVCKIAPAPGSTVRIDIASNGNTKVSVRWGRASVRYEGGAEKVLEQWQRSFADPGYAPTEPAAFDPAAEDAFDSWNRERARQLATGESTARPQSASQPVSRSGRWVYVDGDYYWNPGPHYFDGPAWCDWYGYWGWVPGYGCISAWDYPVRYATGRCGHWYNHPYYGPLWGFGGRHRLSARGSGPAWHHGMNGDEWRHSGLPHGATSSPPFHRAEPAIVPTSSRGHGMSPRSSGTMPIGWSGGRSFGGGFSGGGYGGRGHGRR